jgi:cysteinyl-tRNA synthetase
MSRSAGNAATLKDVTHLGYSGREARYLLLSTHYRQPLSYSDERLKEARAALRRVDTFVAKLSRCPEGRGTDEIRGITEEMLVSFEAAMEADLNVPMALGAIFTLIRKVNQHLSAGTVSKDDASALMDAFSRIHSVLALFDFNPAAQEPEDPGIEALVNLREEARDRKDYEEADRIREDLRRRNVIVQDTPYGPLWWLKA